MKRRFVFFFFFQSWSDINLGIHVDPLAPNIELHVPFGFFKLGWQRSYSLDYLGSTGGPHIFGWDNGWRFGRRYEDYPYSYVVEDEPAAYDDGWIEDGQQSDPIAHVDSHEIPDWEPCSQRRTLVHADTFSEPTGWDAYKDRVHEEYHTDVRTAEHTDSHCDVPEDHPIYELEKEREK